MTGRTGPAVLAAVLLLAAPASAVAQEEETASAVEEADDLLPDWSLGTVKGSVHAGTMGVGVSLAVDVSDDLAIRGVLNHLNYNTDQEVSDIDFDVDLRLQSVGLLLDWRPFDNGFRLSGGAFLNRNEVTADAEATDLEIGNNTYSGTAKASVDFRSLAPYLGLGWSSGGSDDGLGFAVDAGVLFQGAGQLRGSGQVNGTRDGFTAACDFSVSDNGRAAPSCMTDVPGVDSQLTQFENALKADLEAEYREVDDELDRLRFYPVLAARVYYRF